uniref:Uncharacterized protein n=1 Tax=Anguilla anguilla TaxID=7936 RepID=A0A0E9XB45_ANGAN
MSIVCQLAGKMLLLFCLRMSYGEVLDNTED